MMKSKIESLRDKSILVVDDDAGMLRALRKVLSGAGAEVTCADWAGDAVEILSLRQRPYDLVITDMRMPVMTGATLVYAMRQICPTLPVVVLTAFSSPDLKARCLEEGAVAVLEKPLNSTELVAAVAAVLSRDPAGAVS